MKLGRLLFPLRLSASVVVALGLSDMAAPAQDMPPLVSTSGPNEPATSGPAPWAASASANSAAPTDAAQVAQAEPPAAPASPSVAAAPAEPPAAPASPPTATATASSPAAPAPAAEPAPAPETATAPNLTQAELGQLLAPIALYPDQLLSQILMASTYPPEIVEAARWVKDPAHRALKGDALTNALRPRNWDPSVMALVPFPRVLEQMNSQIAWTQRLGLAFVAQQADVMNEVQQLRQQAIAAGTFKSGPQCGCLVTRTAGHVTVAPANPAVVHVPVYDARVIYGPWLYPAYPPYLFPYPVGFAFEPGFFIGFGFGVDVAYYGPLWGWSHFDWDDDHIIVNSVTYSMISGRQAGFAGGVWTHDYARGGAMIGGVAGAAFGHAWAGGRSGSHRFYTASNGRYRGYAGHGGGRYSSFAGHGGFRGGYHGGFAGHGGFHGGHGGYHGGFAGRGGFHGGHGGYHGGFAGHGGYHGGRGGFGSPAAAHGGGRRGHIAMAGGSGHGGGRH